MREQWMTVAEAAATMKIHPRTVERRIAAGKMDSRRNDDGQIEVVVQTSAPFADAAVEAASTVDPFETVREMADRQVDLAAGSASALVRFAQEQAMRAENQLVLARQDAGRYRREAHAALALVATLFILIIVGVGWGMATVTNAQATARMAAEKVTDVTANANQRVSDAGAKTAEVTTTANLRVDEANASARQVRENFDAVQNRLYDAIAARAKAEGELAEYRTELSSGRSESARELAATRPANLLDRIGDLFTGDRPR